MTRVLRVRSYALFLIPILLMRKLHVQVTGFAQGHPVGRWWSEI